MSNLEYHVLLALAGEALHGYAIKEAVARESGGTHTPHAGSLYRVLGRLLGAGLVCETEPRGAVPVHPGLKRRYYALSAAGRAALAAEARRLKGTAVIAEERLGMVSGRG